MTSFSLVSSSAPPSCVPFLHPPLSIFLHCGLQVSASFIKDSLLLVLIVLGQSGRTQRWKSLNVAIVNGSGGSILDASVSRQRQAFMNLFSTLSSSRGLINYWQTNK